MSVVLQPQPVDGHEPASDDVAGLREFLDRHRRVFVLTGAGCSTESGHPRLSQCRRLVEAAAAGAVRRRSNATPTCARGTGHAA